MNVYYDTGVLLPLYVEEAFSAVVSRIVEERAEPIALNQVQETEFGNAVRLKVFRRELSIARAREIMRACDEDIRMGRLIRRPVNWGQAFDETRRLSECVTVKTGCRTLDLVHVAIAMKWGCDHFASADVRQLKAARLAGMKVLDVSV